MASEPRTHHDQPYRALVPEPERGGKLVRQLLPRPSPASSPTRPWSTFLRPSLTGTRSFTMPTRCSRRS